MCCQKAAKYLYFAAFCAVKTAFGGDVGI